MKTILNIYKEVSESLETKSATYIKDELEGKKFGHEDKMYHLELTYSFHIVDDPDYNRETGYGKYSYPKYDETLKFDIEEIGADGDTVRTTDQIKKEEPILYKDLLDYAKDAALEKNA
jgi:hypothetical protein